MKRYITTRERSMLSVYRCAGSGQFPKFLASRTLLNSTRDQTAAEVIYNSLALTSPKFRLKYPTAQRLWLSGDYQVCHLNSDL